MKTLRDGTLLKQLEDSLLDYQDCFWQSQLGKARTYMKDRGFDTKTLSDFRIGQSPEGTRDRFSGRVIFPIFSGAGELVGFSGRDYTGRGIKYLNSSEEDGFEKGKHLFGLNLVRGNIFKSNKAIVVEGFTDVMALYQAGIPLAVAPMSTTMTDHHVRILSRYCSTIIFMFDQDRRGQDNMRKAMKKALEYGFKIQTVKLPDGMDPADYYLKYK